MRVELLAMPMPDIFTDADPSDAKLASYFEEMYEYLLEEGVPEDRLPGPWHMLSRMVRCVDPEVLRKWLDAYVEVESDSTVEGGEAEASFQQARPKPKHRPNYLRALDQHISDQPDVKTRDD